MRGTDEGEARFRALRCFNDPAIRELAGNKGRMDERTVAFFPREGPVRQVIAALAEDSLLPLKEVCESFEFFERVRSKVRAPAIADLAAGHGLTGLLFAVFEREVERVVLVDTEPPPSHLLVIEALARVAPWIRPKIRWVTGRIQDAATHLDAGTSVVAIHACGLRTDACIDVALEVGGAVAVMPCCYRKTSLGPEGLSIALGGELAADVHRSYRLEAAGYRVQWRQVPSVITPMNRILVAARPG